MKFHVIMDSVGDMTSELKMSENVTVVPLQIHIGDETIVDNGRVSQQELLVKIAASPEAAKSSCPSPQLFLELFEMHRYERIYVITGSSRLTGSYNSAKVAEQMFLQKYPETNIHIFDSKSGCAGQPLLVYQIMRLEQVRHNFENIVDMIYDFIAKQQTRFVLQDVSFLQKSGRLTGIKSFVVDALHIVPLLKATPEGEITQAGMARGIEKALSKFQEFISNEIYETGKDFVVISNCNCLERAEQMKEKLEAEMPYLEVRIANTGGISTLYAGDGGIVISY